MDHNIKYVIYETGGCIGGPVSEAYYVADDHVYYADHVFIGDLITNMESVLSTAKVVEFDSTKLDFNEHVEYGDECYMRASRGCQVTIFQFIDGDYFILWSALSMDSTTAVKTIMDLFWDYKLSKRRPNDTQKRVGIFHKLKECCKRLGMRG